MSARSHARAASNIARTGPCFQEAGTPRPGADVGRYKETRCSISCLPRSPIRSRCPFSSRRSLPIILVLVLLGWARRPAWQTSLAGLILALIIAIAGWHFPVGLTVNSVFASAVFTLWPVMWIVFAAILLYNVSQRSGRFEAFRLWMVDNLPNDRRIVLVVIGFSFSALNEGISGFGTPIAITSSLLILLGFPTLEALTFTLIFNTAPSTVTHLPTDALAKMASRQLPLFAFFLPFYVISIYTGFRNMMRVWPVLFVSGDTFTLTQYVTSNYISYALTDVLSSLVLLILTIAFLRVWKPAPDERFAVNVDRLADTPCCLTGGCYFRLIVIDASFFGGS
ncbi:L-lactate permease [Candidatus Burkholderia brachyanthoides]|nr:L-lactate permease [Candidatus Burkholderia brachyanthoides]